MSLPHLLLGLLSANPMSGYDLNKMFNTTVQHFWTTDQSQIYRTLYKLEEEGMVGMEIVIQEDTPNKKVYHITEPGKAELSGWLNKPLAPMPTREAWLGQLFFSYQLDNAAVISVMEARISHLVGHLAALGELQNYFSALQSKGDLSRDHRFQFMTLNYGLEAYRFDIAWLKKAIEEIRGFGEG